MNYKITGILIASGYSLRMGAFKPLLQYEGLSFVSGILLKLALVSDEVVVVVGHQREQIENEINNTFETFSDSNSKSFTAFIERVKNKTRFVYNENYDKGMFTSLQRGLQESNKSDWYLYHFVDQPGLPIIFYNDFVQQLEPEHPWVQPVFEGKNSHPILFNTKIKKMITNTGSSISLKEISRSIHSSKKFWECKYGQIVTDVDTPDDYKKLLAQESGLLFDRLTKHNFGI